MLSIVFKPLDASQGAGLNEAAVQLDVPRTGVLGAQVRAELLSRVELDGCTPYFYVEAADPASEDAGVPSMDASREAGAPGMPTQRALVAVPADVSAEELLRLAGCDGAAPLTVFFTMEQQYGCCVGRVCRIICKPFHCIFRHCCCCCHKDDKTEQPTAEEQPPTAEGEQAAAEKNDEAPVAQDHPADGKTVEVPPPAEDTEQKPDTA